MKIAILTNILTPYRNFFYQAMYDECVRRGINFEVIVMSETEPGRNWYYNEFKRTYTTLLKGKLIQISNIYVIFNKGLKIHLSQYKPDIIVAAGSYMLPTVWQALSFKKKLEYKVLYWSESHMDEERHYGSVKLWLREGFRKKVISKFDGFWFAGEKSRALEEKYAKSSASYIFAPNMINKDKFSSARTVSEKEKDEIRKRFGIDRNKRILICPARLHPAKGILEFIELYKDCHYRNKATIIIPGDGELKDKIEQKIKEYQLDIKLIGYNNEDMMVKLYAVSDIFLLPSKSDPNPLTCIEACWCGLPLLVSEHVGNYPEIVTEGVNGFIFSYNKKKEAIMKIDTILSASSDWLQMAREESLHVAEKVYNPEIVVPRIVDELCQLK